MIDPIGQHDPVEALVEEFLDRQQRGERPTIEEYEARRPELAEELRDLLEAVAVVRDLKPGSRDATGRLDVPASETPESRPPEQVGDYRILREIGRGGMGVVYEAEQESLGRRVALKVLPPLIARDATTLSRFRREARSAARLHHSNIVPVFEVGQDGAVCYYAMQFIHGQGLDAVIEDLRRYREHGTFAPADGQRAVPSERLRIARSMLTGAFRLEAVAEDHPLSATLATTGMMRGDIPGLVPAEAHSPRPNGRESRPAAVATSAAFSGQTGLAAMDSDRRHYFRSVARIGHQVAGALAYAHDRGLIHRDIKPSNLLLDAAGVVWVTDFGLAKTDEEGLTRTGDILGTIRYMAPERFRGESDVRADIYSLGLTLYELLLLRPAFQSPDRLKLIEQVRHQEPTRPRSIDPRIPRDLETIVLKSIDKDSRGRYPTAAALAEDLQRFVEDRPIRARRAGPAERLGRWCRRNPLVASLTTALVLVVLAGFAGVTWKWREAEWQAGNARAAQTKEAEQRMIAMSEADRARAEADRSRRLLYDSEMSLAQQAWDAGDVGRALSLLQKQEPDDGQEDLRGFEWRYLKALCRDGSRLTLRGHAGDIKAVAFSPDGKTMATAASDREIRLWDVASWRCVRLLATAAQALAFSPDGRTLAFAPLNARSIHLWDLAGNRESAILAETDGVGSVAYSLDGTLLAACGGQTIRLWDVATRRRVATLTEPTTGWVICAIFSPDGKTLASGGNDNRVRLWDVASRRMIATLEGHTDWVDSLSYSRDGKTLASASYDTTIRLWDLASGRRPRILRGHKTDVNSVAFSPDGKALASVGSEGTIRIWDAATGEMTALLRGHTTIVWAAAFSPDGRSLASGGRDGLIKVWDLAAGPDPDVLTSHNAGLMSLALSPDGKTLAVCDPDEHENTVKLWDVTSRRPLGVLRGHQRAPWGVAFAPDGRSVATGGADNTVRLWDVAARRESRVFRLDDSVAYVTFSPDGKFLAAGGHGGRAWDLATGRELAHSDPWVRVQFSPDGTRLAASSGGAVGFWDVANWRKIDSLGNVPGADVLGLAFSPDGRQLATRDADGILRLWDLTGRRLIAASKAHTPSTPPSFAGCVAFSPDGRRLATSGGDCVVELWDVGRFQEVAALTGHNGPILGLAFTPDSNMLVSASNDATVRLWRAPPPVAGSREPSGPPAVRPVETYSVFALRLFGTARGTMTTEADAHRIDITAVDGTHWHAQLWQPFDHVEEGATYSVRFRARAVAASSLGLCGQIDEPDWHPIGLVEDVRLSDGWRTYRYEFRAKRVAARNMIVFYLGKRTGAVWLADFSVTKVAR